MPSASRLALGISMSMTLLAAACGGGASFNSGRNTDTPAVTTANGAATNGSGDAAKASPQPTTSAAATTTPAASAGASATPQAPEPAKSTSTTPTPVPAATPTPPPAGQASIDGTVRSAIDNQPLAAATLTLASGAIATSDALGHFTFSGLAAGTAHVTAALPGFTSDAYDVTLTAGAFSTLNILLSPTLATGELRFVLSWAPNTFDLDGHLKGPAPGGGRFHVYFAAKTAVDAHQDIDDLFGNGPETITITSLIDGHYVYYVRDYTDSRGSDAGNIPGPGPVVKVYRGTQVIGAYSPTPAFQAGALTWHVIDVDVVGGVPQLNPQGDAACDALSCN